MCHALGVCQFGRTRPPWLAILRRIGATGHNNCTGARMVVIKPARSADRRANELALAIYKQIYRRGSQTIEAAANELGLTEEEAGYGASELRYLGLASRDGQRGANRLVTPERAIVHVLERQRKRLAEYRHVVAETNQMLDMIVEQFMPIGPAPSRPIDFQVITRSVKVAGFLERMAGEARTELLSMHPGPLPPEQRLVDGLPRDGQLAERGLRLQAIFPRRLTAVAAVDKYLKELSDFGYEVRVAPSVPIRLVVCDAQRAIVSLEPTTGRTGAIVIDGELFVRSLVRVFTHCWQASSPYGSVAGDQAPTSLTEQEMAVLGQLATGTQNAKIARDIGVSVRTVSRVANELMHRLGATSRFQAGIRATQLGLVE